MKQIKKKSKKVIILSTCDGEKRKRMVDKFCEYLTKKIRKEMPEIDDEKAEIILYGIQLIVGEIPKVIFTFVLGALLGVWWQTLLAFFLIIPLKNKIVKIIIRVLMII